MVLQEVQQYNIAETLQLLEKGRVICIAPNVASVALVRLNMLTIYTVESSSLTVGLSRLVHKARIRKWLITVEITE